MRATIDEIVQRKTSKKTNLGLNSKSLIQLAREITEQREENGRTEEEKILLQEERESRQRSKEESRQKESS
jgi:hypothetical protein